MDREIKIKAALYGVPLFLGPLCDKVGPILFQNSWPSLPMFVGCTLLGIISACIGLRAYFDGSYERGKPNGNGTTPASPAPTSAGGEAAPEAVNLTGTG